jgi:predicted DNA-binding transcriptional regulator YafY
MNPKKMTVTKKQAQNGLKPNFELYQKICSYREFVEVLEPEEVRNEMISVVEKLGEMYKS